jgi:hypothetical protein
VGRDSCRREREEDLGNAADNDMTETHNRPVSILCRRSRLQCPMY